MSGPRHRRKGAIHRRLYALVFTDDRRWLRFFYFGPNDWLIVNLDGDPVDPEPLAERLVRVVVDELKKGDPLVRIEVGPAQVRLDWSAV